jgi:hypothetical protein
MKFTCGIAVFIISTYSVIFAQTQTATEVLNKAIAYHDPSGQWAHFNADFTVVMTTSDRPKRVSNITINKPDSFFSVRATRDSVTTYYEINKGKCGMQYNGHPVDSASAVTHGMDCNKALLYQNYYTYLYGLPMKLKDPGTHLSNTPETRQFKGKEYIVLKATYDKSVGSDVWYFYFDPQTYAMEVYQFYKTDNAGNLKANSGEYILLSDEQVVYGIKMPKVRTWYYNKDGTYLGTDTLVEN